MANYDKTLGSIGRVVSFDSFINNDLIHFSNDDLSRSIPNVLDGLKVSQRKIIYSAFKRNLINEVKVAQFAGYTAEHSNYHSGEKSLEDAIAGLARNYTGSNNLELLVPKGGFGSRMHNGHDRASARYIFTHLSPITKSIFDPLDKDILDYRDDDGTSIEPWWYIPIIPMILVNGAIGIGTGFSTDIPCFNPLDLIEYIIRKIRDGTQKSLNPWYRGFTGKVIRQSDTSYITTGVFTETLKDITITELPIGISTDKYLENLQKKFDKVFKNITDLSTDTDINIILTKKKDGDTLDNPIEYLKLFTKISYNNMNAFDAESRIRTWATPESIIDYFYIIRLNFYAKRKASLLSELSKKLKVLSNKIRFIKKVIKKEINISKVSLIELKEILKELSFDLYEDSYEYLYKMSLVSLTTDNMNSMKDEQQTQQKIYDTLLNKSEKELWLEDLEKLKIGINKLEKVRLDELQKLQRIK